MRTADERVSPTVAHEPTRARRGAIVAVLSVAFFLAFLSRYAIAVIVPDLEATFGIGTAEIGLLGAVYFWAYAVMQPPAGLLADSVGPRRAVTVFLLLAAAGTLAFALAPAFGPALVGRAVSGLGVGIVYVCALRVFSRWFRADEFSIVTGVYGAIGNLGGLTAAAPLAGAIAALGWRESFVGLGVLTGLSAVAVWLWVRDAPPGVPGGSPGASVLGGAGTVLRHPNTWLVGAYAFTTLGILSAMQGLWTVPYLRAVYGLGEQAAANALTLWAVGLVIALPLWGMLADKVVRSRRRAILMSITLQGALWALLAWRPAELPLAVVGALVFCGGLAHGCWAPAYAQLKDSLPLAVSGTAVGFLNFAFFAGAAVFQQLTGLLLEHADVDGDPTGAYRLLFGCFVLALSAAGIAMGRSTDAPPAGRGRTEEDTMDLTDP